MYPLATLQPMSLLQSLHNSIAHLPGHRVDPSTITSSALTQISGWMCVAVADAPADLCWQFSTIKNGLVLVRDRVLIMTPPMFHDVFVNRMSKMSKSVPCLPQVETWSATDFEMQQLCLQGATVSEIRWCGTDELRIVPAERIYNTHQYALIIDKA